MFAKITPTADTQLNNAEIANLAVADALEKIQNLTGLSTQKCLALMAQQINGKDDNYIDNKRSSSAFKAVKTIKTRPNITPIINYQESRYISRLFN